MATCPYCSHNLLNHLHKGDRYWYCRHCRLEVSDSFITAENKSTLQRYLRLDRHHSSIFSI